MCHPASAARKLNSTQGTTTKISLSIATPRRGQICGFKGVKIIYNRLTPPLVISTLLFFLGGSVFFGCPYAGLLENTPRTIIRPNTSTRAPFPPPWLVRRTEEKK